MGNFVGTGDFEKIRETFIKEFQYITYRNVQ
jgi:hypothetical protein